MMRAFMMLIAAVALASCGQKPDQPGSTNTVAANDAAATADLSMFAPAASKEAALKVMHERHEGMEGIGKANKLLKQELNSSSPNLDLVRSTAYRLSTAATDASGWFAKGTGPELGKTGAKSEIWQNEADVAAKLSEFQKAAQAFSQAAAGSDVEAMKSRFASLSDTCKACHDKYRSQMHH